MEVIRGLAYSVTTLQEFISELGAAAGGILGPNTPTSLVLNGNETGNAILIEATYTADESSIKDPKIVISYGGYETPLLGSNNNAISLAYEIRKGGSGDVLVKFAQWVTDEPLDIFAESFQSWGIAAYTAGEPSMDAGSHTASFLNYRSLRSNDLLANQNYGGFLLHAMKDGAYGITVFSIDTLAPIYTWAAGAHFCLEGETSYVKQEDFGSYVERKRRYRGLHHTEGSSIDDGYQLWVQEPYDRPKRMQYAVLSPISAISVDGNYSKTSRWLMQSPHLYNPYDSDGYLLIDGGEAGAFYCDHGVCLSAKGDTIADMGLIIPSPNTWLYYRQGDIPKQTNGEYDPGIYGQVNLNYDGTIYDD